MTNAEDYESIANRSYRVDPLRQNPPIRAGATFYTDQDKSKQKWRVVNVSANVSNGFQGMAVVRVINGVEDYSHVYISYAGTNFSDPHDVASDTGVLAGTRISQAEDALAFAAKVKELTHKKHPQATFETVGHSLGGFLALYVAAENRWSSTAFNAPDAWRMLSKETQEWLRKQNAAGTNPLTNYVNRLDTVGNALGNRTGAAVFVDDDPGGSVPSHHNIGKDGTGKPQAFTFDADGGIIGAGVTQVDYGVVLYNVGLTGPAQAFWQAHQGSPYPKVLIAMESATALANTIRGLAEPLKRIKTANTGVVDTMQATLNDAKSAQLLQGPFVHEQDIEACVRSHGLQVHENIDHEEIASTNALVDHHLALVEALHDGIRRAVVSALIHDGQAAEGFRGN
jgi:pimeloyl-ACP methyl ester carboxylesterase